MTLFVTGAAGFIGSNLVLHLRQTWPDRRIVSLDALTYCGNLENLAALQHDPQHVFIKGDITDRELIRSVFDTHTPTGVFHLAAESHVDRSILDPLQFVQTNVQGTVVLLQEAQRAWQGRTDVRFHHVSTDEVFGSLGSSGKFSEHTPYDPQSPYAASKAASDHFVRAWINTYKLPIVITNCSNNYGPYQFPEKLIPVVIQRALASDVVPVYGQGLNIRDWLYVEDHSKALSLVFDKGRIGETYCIGGDSEITNIDLVHTLLDILDAKLGNPPQHSRSLVRFVKDRPGHDMRYAIDATKIRHELGWKPSVTLQKGLERTVDWYVNHRDWCERARQGAHRQFEEAWYSDRR